MNIIQKISSIFGNRQNAITVPPGYDVKVYQINNEPAFYKTPSGIILADFGSTRNNLVSVLSTAYEFLQENPTALIVWILQKDVIDYWASDAFQLDMLLWQFHGIQNIRGKGNEASDTVYIAKSATNAKAVMFLFKELGIRVFNPGQHEEVYVEIYDPNKQINIAFTGVEFEEQRDGELSGFFLARDKANEIQDEEKRTEIERKTLAYIHKTIQSASNIGKSDTPLSDLITKCANNWSAYNYEQFLKEFQKSRVGVFATGREEDNGTITFTEANSSGIAATTTPDGRKMLLVFADTVPYAINFGKQFNAYMMGNEVFDVVFVNPDCEGILVNSALSDKGMIISREKILSIYKPLKK